MRTLKSAIFGAKNYLIKWGFEKGGLWGDIDKGILQYRRKTVLSVTVEGEKMQITYDPKWEWHFNHTEWIDTVSAIRAKLERVGEKGTGKGKAAPE